MIGKCEMKIKKREGEKEVFAKHSSKKFYLSDRGLFSYFNGEKTRKIRRGNGIDRDEVVVTLLFSGRESLHQVSSHRTRERKSMISCSAL